MRFHRASTDQTPNPMYRKDSPTPSMKPTPSSEELMMTMFSQMMTTMANAHTGQVKEIREMVLDLVQGRQQLIGQTATEPIENERPLNYDEDLLVSSGIEGVLQREAEETLQQRLVKERHDLQQRLRELTLDLAEMEAPDPSDLSLSIPWENDRERSDFTTSDENTAT